MLLRIRRETLSCSGSVMPHLVSRFWAKATTSQNARKNPLPESIARTHRSMAFEALGLLVPAAHSRRCSFCRRCFTASGRARGVCALHQDPSCVGEAISAQELSAAGSRMRATPPRVPGSSDLHVPQCQHDSASFSTATAPPQRTEGRGAMDARQ